MDATSVDWSMGSRASKLADWDLALQVGRRVAGPGVSVVPVHRARVREELAVLVPEAERLITGFTGLDPGGSRARAWVMSRREWIRQNLLGLQRLIEPLAERIAERQSNRPEISRKALGLQSGALLGYVSRRVLGQYDAFLPPDDEGLLYFVGPNLVEVERTYRLPPRDFRLWVSLHEVTHRVQFGAADWLRVEMQGLIDAYLDTISLEGKDLVAQLRRAVEEARQGGDRHGMGAIFLLLTPEQRELFVRVQSLMSLLEGHASFVMNEVARGHVRDVDRMRRALSARRKTRGVEKTFQRAIGFDQKVAQYDVGERFVRAVIDRAGMDTFNLVWTGPEHLPTLDEIRSPDAWLARVAGG
jgi:coenzyme F420 biosynthesis associated uncharacterized protein